MVFSRLVCVFYLVLLFISINFMEVGDTRTIFIIMSSIGVPVSWLHYRAVKRKRRINKLMREFTFNPGDSITDGYVTATVVEQSVTTVKIVYNHNGIEDEVDIKEWKKI